MTCDFGATEGDGEMVCQTVSTPMVGFGTSLQSAGYYNEWGQPASLLETSFCEEEDANNYYPSLQRYLGHNNCAFVFADTTLQHCNNCRKLVFCALLSLHITNELTTCEIDISLTKMNSVMLAV